WGAIRLFTDALGQKIAGNQPEVYTNLKDKQRSQVLTTLDLDYQKLAEDILGQRYGAIVVMNRSGELLALASSPGFNPDPEKLADYLDQPESLLDQTTALFQPGSIFKIVVAAAALEEKIVTEEQLFVCQGARDELIPCWKKQGHGRITFAEAFAQSCNPVFAQLAKKLGAAKIIEYAQKLGLNNQKITGYPVSRQTEQDLSQIAWEHNLSNSAIGQGPVLVTPVQVAALLNTLINGGIYQQPCLVKAIQKGENVQSLPREKGRRAISVPTALTLQKLLIKVVENGVGQNAALSSGGCGGKTGSAEVGDGTINAWFSGFLPASNPQYIIAVLIREGESGSATAAPLFKQIGEALHISD
ncbi:MAG: penicillin-binding protein 2, partial [Clostridia bacterium]|nr:penicillin-binding protein 2 [Clostridia bacterium]